MPVSEPVIRNRVAKVAEVLPAKVANAGALQRGAKDEAVEGAAVERPGAGGVREHPLACEPRGQRAEHR